MRRALGGLTAREIRQKREDDGGIIKAGPVTQSDFMDALENVNPSVGQADIFKFEAWAREFGSR